MEQLPNVSDPQTAVRMAVLVSNAYLDHAIGRKVSGTSVSVSNTTNHVTANIGNHLDPAMKREIFAHALLSVGPAGNPGGGVVVDADDVEVVEADIEDIADIADIDDTDNEGG